MAVDISQRTSIASVFDDGSEPLANRLAPLPNFLSFLGKSNQNSFLNRSRIASSNNCSTSIISDVCCNLFEYWGVNGISACTSLFDVYCSNASSEHFVRVGIKIRRVNFK